MRHVPKLSLVVVVAVLTLVAAPGVASAAPNDAFTAPTDLVSGATPTAADNVDTTSEPGEPDPGNLAWPDCAALTSRAECGSTVWFTFTAPTTASYVIETCDVSNELDTLLTVYTGASLGALAQVGTNDDACDGGGGAFGSRVTVSAAAGVRYRVQVSGYQGQTGTFYVRAYPSALPPGSPAADTRITRYQSITAGAPNADGSGAQSGRRRTASFGFTSTAADATFECAMDGGTFTTCGSPASYDGLADDGTVHRFRVRSITGAVADPTPAVQVFTLDRTAPDTTFGSGPAEGSSVPSPVSFLTRGSERNRDFLSRCTLDAGAAFPCNGTGAFALGNLCNGPHTVSAAAMDAAGNRDATPATRSFTITGASACSAPVLGVPSLSLSPTQAQISVSLATGGTAATTTLRIGATTAYGETLSAAWKPGSFTATTIARGLKPGTTYHYEVTATTATGATATTGDQTFATPSLSGGAAAPALTVGDPVLAGEHAARIPITTDVGTPAAQTQVLVFVDDHGPISTTSPSVYRDSPIPGSTSGTVPVPIDLIDLEPSTTYHYRVLVVGAYNTLSDERTFTTPAPQAPPTTVVVPAPAAPVTPKVTRYFLIAKNLVTVGTVSRRSRAFTVKVRGLPRGTKVALTIKSRKTLGRGSAKAPASGAVTLKVKLGAAARRALRVKRLKQVVFTVSATPPGDVRSTVTLTKRLR